MAVAQGGEAIRRQLDAQQHREDALLVVIVHLDFGDVGPLAGDVVHDRIGEAAVVGADGGDVDLHRVSRVREDECG